VKLLCFIYSVECVALNACSCVTSVVLLLPPPISLSISHRSPTRRRVPNCPRGQRGGGSRDNLDVQIGEREREKQKRCDKRQQQQPRTRESNRRNRLRASSFSATAIYPHDTITLLPFSVFPVVPSCTTGCGELFQLQVPNFPSPSLYMLLARLAHNVSCRHITLGSMVSL
jgi:hypothetical protein